MTLYSNVGYSPRKETLSVTLWNLEILSIKKDASERTLSTLLEKPLLDTTNQFFCH